MTTQDVSGGYRCLEGVFQYSGGVRALDGYHIERVRFRDPPAISDGFERIERYLGDLDLPLTSFAPASCAHPPSLRKQDSAASTKAM